MISRKFSELHDEQIARFIIDDNTDYMTSDVINGVDSVTDLWALANMNRSMNDEKADLNF